MISCIICSRKPDIPNTLKQNIASTIGCEYELIVIDNSLNQYTIFSAYNEGVKRSKGDILCFMHEDILFHTSNWGNLVVEHFIRNSHLGLIGVEGTHYMPKYAASWWSASMSSGQMLQGNIIDGEYVSNQEFLWSRKRDNADSIEVVVVDGLWMCIRKSLFDNGLVLFDEKTYNNFHCYDADICMQVIKSGYEVRVAYDIMIEHKSLGTPNVQYFEQLDIWYEKWKDMLPITRGVNLSEIEKNEREIICRRYTDLFRSNQILIKRLDGVCSSKAYKLGKMLLSPFKRV